MPAVSVNELAIKNSGYRMNNGTRIRSVTDLGLHAGYYPLYNTLHVPPEQASCLKKQKSKKRKERAMMMFATATACLYYTLDWNGKAQIHAGLLVVYLLPQN